MVGISSAGGMLAMILLTVVAIGLVMRVAAPSAGDCAFVVLLFFPLPPIAEENGGAEDDDEGHGFKGGYIH